MSSFVFFNIEELQKSMNEIEQIIKSIDEFKDNENVDENIRILKLSIECISGYQEFLIKLSKDNIVKMDFNMEEKN